MTIARDKTGAVIGQVAGHVSPPVDFYTGEVTDRTVYISLLTRDGYVTVPRSSVRLEEIRDN